MMHVMTEEEVAEGEQLRWDALSAGSIFSTKDENDRMFIAVEKNGDRIEAIELHPENIQRIVDSGCCQRNAYTFDEIKIWALHDPESQNRQRTAYRKLHPVPDWTTINPEIYCRPISEENRLAETDPKDQKPEKEALTDRRPHPQQEWFSVAAHGGRGLTDIQAG